MWVNNLNASRALRDHGTVPEVVDRPEMCATARAGDCVAPEGKLWLEAYEETLAQALRPGMLRAAE
jgi:hypothetical protein